MLCLVSARCCRKDDLVPQFQMVRDFLDAAHIKWVEMPDIEADDLIGTMSKKYPDCQTIIFTSDHDLLQLVDDTTSVLLMKKGMTDMDIMTPESMQTELGIRPLQIIDLKGLMGDHSDNIPGIPGVGEKTAVKLLNQYDTLENVLAHDQEIKGALGKSRYQSRLLGNQEQKAEETIQVQRVSVIPENVYTGRYAVFGCDDHQQFMGASLYGLGIASQAGLYYINAKDLPHDAQLLKHLAAYEAAGYDVKRLMHVMHNIHIEIHFRDDAMIIASLADSTLTSNEKITEKYDLHTTDSYEDVFGKPGRPVSVDEEKEARFAGESAANILKIVEQAEPVITSCNMTHLYRVWKCL